MGRPRSRQAVEGDERSGRRETKREASEVRAPSTGASRPPGPLQASGSLLSSIAGADPLRSVLASLAPSRQAEPVPSAPSDASLPGPLGRPFILSRVVPRREPQQHHRVLPRPLRVNHRARTSQTRATPTALAATSTSRPQLARASPPDLPSPAMSSSRSVARIYPDANERFGESWHNYDALMVRGRLSLPHLPTRADWCSQPAGRLGAFTRGRHWPRGKLQLTFRVRPLLAGHPRQLRGRAQGRQGQGAPVVPSVHSTMRSSSH